MARTPIFALFCCVNFLNFLDRGIIPGAPTQFQYFIQSTQNVPASEGGFYLGLLASSFVASYALFVLVFGYLSIFVRPFRLVSVGLFVWCVAVTLCGVAKHANSFELLVFGRLLSGIGESSFQCIAPAFIDAHAPPAMRSVWLGVFYACSSVGLAFGVQYGAVMAESTWGWDWAFFLEAAVVLPLAIVCLCGIPDSFNERPLDNTTASQKQSLLREVWQICRDGVFSLIVWGTAASVFSLAGLSTFGTLFLVGLNVFETDIDASLVLGCVVVASGIFGTPIGGILLDWEAGDNAPSKRQVVALRQLTGYASAVVVFALLSWVVLPQKSWFLLFYALALILYAASTAAAITALLLCVEPSRRALATGVYALFVHLLGDVPSPILIGALKDKLAPHCNSVVTADGEIRLNPDCHRVDANGLLYTMLYPLLWMGWSALGYGVAWYIARRRNLVSNPVNQVDLVTVTKV